MGPCTGGGNAQKPDSSSFPVQSSGCLGSFTPLCPICQVMVGVAMGVEGRVALVEEREVLVGPTRSYLDAEFYPV